MWLPFINSLKLICIHIYIKNYPMINLNTRLLCCGLHLSNYFNIHVTHKKCTWRDKNNSETMMCYFLTQKDKNIIDIFEKGTQFSWSKENCVFWNLQCNPQKNTLPIRKVSTLIYRLMHRPLKFTMKCELPQIYHFSLWWVTFCKSHKNERNPQNTTCNRKLNSKPY